MNHKPQVEGDQDDMLKKIEEQETRVGERSLVTLGLAVGIGGFLLVQTAAGFWWASRITTTLDTLVKKEEVTSTESALKSAGMLTRIENLERAVDKINAAGSPRLSEIEKSLDDLTRKVEVHIESTKGIKP